jgi:DNA adenine methylase
MKPPLAYFGGKTAIPAQIATLLPEHKHYVEPSAGSLAVLLAKPPSRLETVNDLAEELVNFRRVRREDAEALARVCALAPHSGAQHQLACERADDPLERPWATVVWLTQPYLDSARTHGASTVGRAAFFSARQ